MKTEITEAERKSSEELGRKIFIDLIKRYDDGDNYDPAADPFFSLWQNITTHLAGRYTKAEMLADVAGCFPDDE